MKVLVTGAGGFIGGHLVKRLLDEGHEVRAVDLKPQERWFQWHYGNVVNWAYTNLSNPEDAAASVEGMDWVFNLAADMGGMGFIENNKTLCMLNVLISTNMVSAAYNSSVERFFYASSACVYNTLLQGDQENVAMSEEMAYSNGGAMPEDGYGWEKLFSERLCQAFCGEHDMEVRIARYHNVYGPQGEWHGGREKAPAALCRKMIESQVNGTDLDVWGNGEQRRSFTFIDDAIEGTMRLMATSNLRAFPLNIGSDELVTIDGLIDMLEKISEHHPARVYDLSAPLGVHGRCSDNTNIKKYLNWEPICPLSLGLELTYRWIFEQMREENK